MTGAPSAQFAGSQPGHPPAGYVAFGSPDQFPVDLLGTAVVRQIAIGLIWLATLLSGATTFLLFRRVGVVDGYLAGRNSLTDVDASDELVLAVSLIQVATVVIAAIFVATWSYRAVTNAGRLSGNEIGAGMAAGGWFIPIGNMWLPFNKLRSAVTDVRGTGTPIGRWQAAWIATVVVGWLSRFSGVGSVSQTQEELRETLSNQAYFSVLSTLILVVTAFAAQYAIRYTDRVIARRHDERNRPTDAMSVPGF